MAANWSSGDRLLREKGGALQFDLRLTPKAKQSAITGTATDVDGNTYLKASVTAQPEHGKANAAVIKLLAKEWRIAKSQITITHGQTNTRKKIEITGKMDKVRPLITTWLNNRLA